VAAIHAVDTEQGNTENVQIPPQIQSEKISIVAKANPIANSADPTIAFTIKPQGQKGTQTGYGARAPNHAPRIPISDSTRQHFTGKKNQTSSRGPPISLQRRMG
jgi:hypothetical protein